MTPPVLSAEALAWAENQPALALGDRGPDVERAQHMLAYSDFDLVADGEFGPKTRAAVIAFQKLKVLIPDGAIGKRTWAALRDEQLLRQTDPERWGWGEQRPSSVIKEPTRPDFAPIAGNYGRQAVFGKFRYAAAPSANNPEAIRFLDDWPEKNVLTIHVPQLAKIRGVIRCGRAVGAGPSSGNVSVHRLVAEQMKALWQAWEDAGLLDRVITWAGMWNPRFIRRSRSVLSNHAFATAFDINAPWNGLGRRPAKLGEKGCVWELVPLAHQFGFFWGGHFSRRDGMHFEVAVVGKGV